MTITDQDGNKVSDTTTVIVDIYPALKGWELIYSFVSSAIGPVVNLKDDPSGYYPLNNYHSLVTTLEGREFYLYRDYLENMFIDNQYKKFYSIGRDGIPGSGGRSSNDFNRTEIGYTADPQIDTMHTFIIQWKGYTLTDWTQYLSPVNDEVTIIW